MVPAGAVVGCAVGVLPGGEVEVGVDVGMDKVEVEGA